MARREGRAAVTTITASDKAKRDVILT